MVSGVSIRGVSISGLYQRSSVMTCSKLPNSRCCLKLGSPPSRLLLRAFVSSSVGESSGGDSLGNRNPCVRR